MHDINLLKDFDFWSYVDHAISRDRFKGARRFGLHPSSASVVANENGYRYVIGGCHRAAAYGALNVPESNPTTTKSKYIFEFGNMVETMIRDKIKESGLFEASSVKFYYPKLKISGELDIVVRHPKDPEKFVIVEVKSTYGYYSKKTLAAGAPKDANFCQILTYLWTAMDDPKTFSGAENVIGGKLIYLLRDTMDRYSFDIAIEKDEETGVYWPVIDGKRDTRFTIDDLMRRYKILYKHMANINKELMGLSEEERTVNNAIKLKSLPPRDYVLKYNDEEIEELHDRGEIKKTEYEKWARNKTNMKNRPGHWMCSYCRWKDICWTPDEINRHLNGEV